MRILTFLHSFAPGGVERDALRLLAALKREGLDVPVVMGRGTGAMAAPELDYHVLDRDGRTAAYETLWMIWRLPGLIRQLRPDVLYCAGNTYSIVAVMMRLVLGRACPPMVIKISNDLRRRDMIWPVRAVYHLWVRVQLRMMAGIVAMAPAAVDEIMAVGRVARGRISMIRNPCFVEAELDGLAGGGSGGECSGGPGVRYLSVGRLVPQKNQALLIRAFAQVAGPDDRLVILGEGRRRGALEALVAELGLGDRVALPGHVDQPAAHYRAADVFVLSSDYEGLGVVVVEALAAGLPLVVTDCCVNMAELVADGRGRMVAVRDVEALAAAMRAAGDDVRAAVAVNRQGMRALAAQFTVEAALPAQMALFRRAAGES